ncbi:glutamine-rich protein 2 [Manis javanica]|uniref:glutamine-rich protein 2 n=1 Tax=Manis javanica TaxID=9974 RepID=UPI003C6CC948
MPPAAAPSLVSLRELVDLSIGTPEVGAVNFTALHTLLVAMLKNLNLQDTQIDFHSPLPEQSRVFESSGTAPSVPHQADPKEKPRSSSVSKTKQQMLENQVTDLGGQVQDLSKQLKTMESQVQGIVTHMQHITTQVGQPSLDIRELPVEETALLMPERMRTGSMKAVKDHKVVSATQAVELHQDVMKDVKTLKDQQKAQEHPELSLQKAFQRIDELEKLLGDQEDCMKAFQRIDELEKLLGDQEDYMKAFQRIDELEKLLRDQEDCMETVSRKLSLIPAGEDVTMVTWEELEQAITDGWRASQAGLESPTAGLPKHKGQASFTSNGAAHSGVPTKHPSIDQAPDSASGLGSDRTLLGISGTGYPSEGIASREQGRVTSAAGFPDREQHVRAGDEAGLAKPHHPPVSQFKTESDRHRTSLPPHLRRDDRDAHPGPEQQDSPSARDGHHHAHPDQHGGLPISQGHIYQHRSGPAGMDPLILLHPSAHPQGVVPFSMGQLGVMPPGMDEQGLVVPGVSQRVVPPLVPGRDQQGLELPSPDQSSVVPLSTYQHGMILPGTDQRGMEQPGTDDSDMRSLGMDQHRYVMFGTDQQGPVPSDVDRHGSVLPFTDQHGLVSPGLVQVATVQRGFVQPSLETSGFIQPGTEQHVIQPGPGQPALVQPGIDQRGLRQHGTDLRGLILPGTEFRGLPTFHTGSRSFLSPHPYQHGMVPSGRDQHGQVPPLLASQDLASTGIDQEGLVPPEIHQQGRMHPGTARDGPTPSRTSVGSAHPEERHLLSPGPDQRGRAYPVLDSHDVMYPGPHGPGYPGVDEYIRVGSDPNQIHTADQPGISLQTTASQEASISRNEDYLSSLYQVSPGKSDTQRERRASLDKLASSFPMAVEAFRLMGKLIGLYMELKKNTENLDEEQAGQTDLEKIQYLLTLMAKKTVPPDLQEQLNTFKTLTAEVQQDKAKLDKMQRILEGEGEQGKGEEMKDGQLSLQLGTLRVTVADIEKELAELRESQERGKVSVERSVSEASLHLQEQLDKLRTIIENMLASSSTLLSMSMAPHKALTPLAPGQIDPEATCPACSLDLSHQVSTLVQRYEQLQDMVSSLAVSRASKRAKLQSQDEELLGHVQNAILQVQGNCEKLNITTSNLIEDHRQKQKDIDVLYQSLEKLQKEKANKEHLAMEIDVKADKSALAAKVSRIQFDATTEQLNHMMQELVTKMSGQEQDWQKMLDKLLTEMDSKLDRLELDPVKRLLEDRWESLRQQLRERSPFYQADEAAAMRRQLLAHFHCLSCDRPLETPVTGEIIPVTPVGPGLPGHRSLRPYTVFELEQVRQQSRNLKLGSAAFPRGDLAQVERSVGRLHTMHARMLMDIEKVQIHFGGSVKASSQMIRELLQAQCLSSPCYKRVPDTADYTYSTVPRSCGGSHTLAQPHRHGRLQHPAQGLYPTEEIRIAMKHDEVDILGLDGHIYKGRMDTRLPDILRKDTTGVTRPKTKQSQPHVHQLRSLSDDGQLPSRPQSAQTLAGNNSATARQRRERPVSSEVRLSQPNVAHPPSPSEVAHLPAGLGMHMDMPSGEGLEEPTRGPRSTTAHRGEP